MAWRQLVFPLGEIDLAELEKLLLENGAQAISLSDAGDQPIFEPDPDNPALWQQTRVTVLLNDAADPNTVILNLVAHIGDLPEYRVESLQDRNWEREWLKDFKPIKFGQRLWIVPTAFKAPEPNAVNILLDPGLAFGTGTHSTTALCLEWLDANVKSFANANVIDYGCGSGVLGIAAALLGANKIFAVDIDAQALQATSDNAASNDVSEQFCIGQLPKTPAKLVLANILAGPLLELAAHFAEHTATGGSLLLSGIFAEQGAEIRNTYSRWFTIQSESQRDGWLCIHAVRTE